MWCQKVTVRADRARVVVKRVRSRVLPASFGGGEVGR